MRNILLAFLVALMINSVVGADFLTDCQAITKPGDYIITGEINHNRHIGSCFKVYTDNVSIECQSDNLIGDMKTAFEMFGVSNVTVRDCHASGFSFGARLYNSENITLENNNFANNTIGIVVLHSDSNLLKGNLIANNSAYGIQMKYSNNNTIDGNTFKGNAESINLLASKQNRFSRNLIVDSTSYGINFYLSNLNTIEGNVICENTYGFKEPYYLINYYSSNACHDSLRCQYECNPQCKDNDGDGYYETPGCGFVVDCDDHRGFVYPTAREICQDGIDENCNGLVDENCQGEVITTTSSTTTTVPKSGSVVLCDTKSTNCYYSCGKVCPDSFDYCNIDFLGSGKIVRDTLNGGERLPWVASSSRLDCFVEGVYPSS